MPRVTLTRLTGYRRSRRGDNDAQLFAQSRTLRIRQGHGLDLSTAVSISPLQHRYHINDSDGFSLAFAGRRP